MSTTAISIPVPSVSVDVHRPRPPARLRRTLALQTRADAPDVLMRVLSLLLRRRCVVAHVEFLAADRHRPGRLVVAFDAPAAHADRIADWLHALVDVLAVEVVG
jgi:acetolactate synthase small subunit